MLICCRTFITLLLVGLCGCSAATNVQEAHPHAKQVESHCYEFMQSEELDYSSECFYLLADLGRADLATYGLGTLALFGGQVRQAKELFVRSHNLGFIPAILGIAIVQEIEGDLNGARRHYELYLRSDPHSVHGMHNYAQFLRLNSSSEVDFKLADRLLKRTVILNAERKMQPYYGTQTLVHNKISTR
jgi:hypothetical protein